LVLAQNTGPVRGWGIHDHQTYQRPGDE
jgi:hypothetical protein